MLPTAGCAGTPPARPIVELPERAAPGADGSNEPATGPLTPEGLLARLPRDAGAYAALRPADFDAAIAPLLADALRDREVHALFGEAQSLAALLERLGVDASRPIVFGVSAPGRGDGAELVDMLASDARWEDLAPRIEAMPPTASTYRVVLPLGANADALEGLRTTFERFGLETKRCPGDARCDRFGAERAALIVHRRPWIGAVFIDGATAELELARTRTWRAEHAETWALLARAREAARGGPVVGRCAMEDLSGAAWVCVDADRFAAYGIAEGNLTIADALSGFGFDPGERARIAAQGREEVSRIPELASPRRRLLDGGSAALRFTGLDYELEARWHTTDASRAGVERALRAPRCGTPRAHAPFVDALRNAFPDPGPDFADAEAKREHLAEAGFGGQGVAFARTWPNLLGLDPGELRRLARELGGSEACAAHREGRLHITLRGRVSWGGAR